MTIPRTLPTISSFPSSSPSTPIRHEDEGLTKCYQYKLHGGDFRSVALSAAQNLIFLLKSAKWKAEHAKPHHKFSKSDQMMPQSARVPESELQATLTTILQSTLTSPTHATLLSKGTQIISQLIAATTIRETIRSLDALAAFHTEALVKLGGQAFSPLAPPPSKPKETGPALDIGKRKVKRPMSYFTFTIERYPERLIVSWPLEFGEDYVKAATSVAGTLRAEQRDPCFVDFVAFHIGYLLLQTGHQITESSRGLGTVGFRKDTQTYLSLGDSGEGHVWGTTRKNRWMRGVVVHVENQERPISEQIESYRPPSIHDFARTRLHTGASAPNTYYIGRAMRDSRTGDFGFDFVKVVNTTSAAATAAFRLGAAECVVAMEGLTTGQMVSYMRGLGGHVLRGYKQVLSAAFNLDQPILDDSPEGEEGKQHPKVLVDKMEIARRAIELTVLGGFDKIIWGADGYNSSIHELGFRNSLELVHRAHEFGLTTYMSAGLKVHNIKDAVLSGLDGVGVGAGVIRAIDQRTGMQGPYRESQIDKLTVARDNAANSVRGRGVHLLARLDQMFFLGTLTHDEYILRNQLYTALYSKNESEVQRILCDDPAALRVASISDDGELPWVGKAKRILRSEYPLLRSGVGKVKDGEVLWDEFCRCLEVLVSEEDDEGIYAYYDSESWRAFRKAYREVMGQSELGQGDNRITLKIGPYSV